MFHLISISVLFAIYTLRKMAGSTVILLPASSRCWPEDPFLGLLLDNYLNGLTELLGTGGTTAIHLAGKRLYSLRYADYITLILETAEERQFWFRDFGKKQRNWYFLAGVFTANFSFWNQPASWLLVLFLLDMFRIICGTSDFIWISPSDCLGNRKQEIFL